MIINTEWGAFGEQGELDFIRTRSAAPAGLNLPMSSLVFQSSLLFASMRMQEFLFRNQRFCFELCSDRDGFYRSRYL